MSLSSRLVVAAVSTLTSALDLATGTVPLSYTKSISLSDGTGSQQADKVWHDQRTIAASASESFDLAGGLLVDAFGATASFARIKGIVVAAAAGNINNVVVGAAGANPWSTLLGVAGTLTVRPGGVVAAVAPDAVAYGVTPGTGDILKVANSGAGTAVVYDIVIIGSSA